MKAWYIFPFIPFISGWFCVYIPAGLFDSANSCVGQSAFVGQKIRNEQNGKIGTVKELRGRHQSCQTEKYPIRATVEYD